MTLVAMERMDATADALASRMGLLGVRAGACEGACCARRAGGANTNAAYGVGADGQCMAWRGGGGGRTICRGTAATVLERVVGRGHGALQVDCTRPTAESFGPECRQKRRIRRHCLHAATRFRHCGYERVLGVAHAVPLCMCGARRLQPGRPTQYRGRPGESGARAERCHGESRNRTRAVSLTVG